MAMVSVVTCQLDVVHDCVQVRDQYLGPVLAASSAAALKAVASASEASGSSSSASAACAAKGRKPVVIGTIKELTAAYRGPSITPAVAGCRFHYLHVPGTNKPKPAAASS